MYVTASCGSLVVVLGHILGNSVNIYDPESDTWATGPPLPRHVWPLAAVGSIRAVAHEGQLHLLDQRAGSFTYKNGAWVETGGFPTADYLGLGSVRLG